MPTEHILRDVDTLQSLSMQYFHTSERWQEIATVNKLDYPYILTSRTQLLQYHANGYIKLERAYSPDALTLYAGSILTTRINSRDYEVVEPITFGSGETEGTALVRCVDKGTSGNLLAGTTLHARLLKTSEGDVTDDSLFIRMYTELPIFNGQDVNVKVTGDTILIPIEGAATEVLPGELSDYLLTLGGEDMPLVDGDMLESGIHGDLASVSGVDNIVEAIRNRLMTRAGSLILHPWYGTRLDQIIGQTMTPYTAKLIELEIVQALSYEDRIEDISVNEVRIEGTNVYVNISFRATGTSAYREIQSLRLHY